MKLSSYSRLWMQMEGIIRMVEFEAKTGSFIRIRRKGMNNQLSLLTLTVA
jgi:hypothetical protein